MSACFGLFHWDGTPVEAESLASIDRALAGWGPDGGGLHSDGPVGLGSRLRRITPEDQHDLQPMIEGPLVLVAHARLDNRTELCRRFALADRPDLPDSALVLHAYRRYHDDCVRHLLGDWVFALWDKERGRLLLARDASGNTSLFWRQHAQGLVFATGLNGILAHPRLAHQPDLRAIAGLLTVFVDPDEDDSTPWQDVRRLKPGHRLSADQRGLRVERWWRPETLSPLELPTPDDYHQAFLALYEDAVAQRLRVHGGTVAATLSGGLDSGSVVALAAPQLARRGQALEAYVHRPLHPPSATGPLCGGDEFALAQQTAAHVGNVAAIPLRAGHIPVLHGIAQALAIHGAPFHAIGNQHWVTDILETARDAGHKVLLTGQGGNATVSYGGHGSLLPDLLAGRLGRVLRSLRDETSGLWPATKRRLLKPLVHAAALRFPPSRQASGATPWAPYSAINAGFARELGLLERMRHSGFDPSFAAPYQNPAVVRSFRLGLHSRGAVNSLWMAYAAAYGLDVRDPTMDQRLVEFCWRVPDEIFWARGQQRGLIRQGMARQLPPEVLHNRQRGLQSVDSCERLRRDSRAIEALLDELSGHSLARRCLDLPRMRKILAALPASEPTPAQAREAQTVLARGLGVGQFLLRF